jgi:hypothetical protein
LALFPSEIICVSLAAGALPGNDASSYKAIWTPTHCASPPGPHFTDSAWLFGWKTYKRKQAGTRCSKRLKIGEDRSPDSTLFVIATFRG